MPAPREFLRWCAAAFAAATVGLVSVNGRAQVPNGGSNEYQAKAAQICAWLRYGYVKWPDRKFTSPEAPIVIGIFGEDRISEQLRENIRSQRYQSRPVEVRKLATWQEAEKVHVLFISNSEQGRLDPILRKVRGENVLTVGECSDFIRRGGVINFVPRNGKWYYELSFPHGKRERLTLDPMLLRYALPPESALAVGNDSARVADTR
jgi:YfiR/HmsC-like